MEKEVFLNPWRRTMHGFFLPPTHTFQRQFCFNFSSSGFISFHYIFLENQLSTPESLLIFFKSKYKSIYYLCPTKNVLACYSANWCSVQEDKPIFTVHFVYIYSFNLQKKLLLYYCSHFKLENWSSESITQVHTSR